MTRTCIQTCLALSLSASLFAQQAAVAPTTASNPPAPAASNNPPIPAAPPQPHTLLDGTPVKLRLTETISSANAKVGQEIPFEVLEDLKVDDIVVLPKGATAIGTVTEANPKKSMGRGGKLNISITYARLADQEKAALRAVQDNKGGGHIGAMTGAMVATSIVFFPAAPLFLFIHGKDISIPQGTEITAFVQGDMHLDMMKFGAPPAESAFPPVAAPAGKSGLYIESTPSGADIDVDGNFVGSTPSTVFVAPGPHEISVHKNGFTPWTRKMDVNAPTVHLSADLDKAN
jgi:hypothetical protein